MLFFLFFAFTSIIFAQNKYPLDSDYYKPEERIEWMKSLSEAYPDYCAWKILGFSSNENLPIYGIKISDNVQEKEAELRLLIVGQHQSEEPVGTEIGIHFLNYLLTANESNKDIQMLLSQIELWFIPTLNPEGDYLFRDGQYERKRKNNSDTNEDNEFSIELDGVDLNKNYPVHWDGSILDNPTSAYYGGKYPASENETQVMMNFVNRHQFASAILYHSSYSGNFSEMIFFPWNIAGYKSENYDNMKQIGNILSTFLKKDYQEDNYTLHDGFTSESGFCRDYLYETTETFTFTIETCGNLNGYSISHPKNSQLKKIINKHQRMLLVWMNFFHDHSVKFFNTTNSKSRYHFKNAMLRSEFPVSLFTTQTQRELLFSDDFRPYQIHSATDKFYGHTNNKISEIKLEKLPDNNSLLQIRDIEEVSWTENKQLNRVVFCKIDKEDIADFSLQSVPYYIQPKQKIERRFHFNKFYRSDKKMNAIKLKLFADKRSLLKISIINQENEEVLFNHTEVITPNKNIVDIPISNNFIAKSFSVRISNEGNNPVAIARKVRGFQLHENFVRYRNWQHEQGLDFAILIKFE